MPDLIGQLRLDQEVTWEHPAFDDLFNAAHEVDNLLSGNQDVAEGVFHLLSIDLSLERRLNPVLIARMGVYRIPTFLHLFPPMRTSDHSSETDTSPATTNQSPL